MLARNRRSVASALLAAALCFCSGSSRAGSEERPLPDYDGRRDPQPTPGEVIAWVPRVLLFPAYVLTEYVVRAPLGYLIATAERHDVPVRLYDFFTFGDEHQGGIVPTAYADFDFYPSVGLYSFWNGAFHPQHDLRFRAAFGGKEWLSASLSERLYLTSQRRGRFVLEAAAERRPDFAFFGLGPDTRQDELLRYGRDTLELRAQLEQQLWRASSFHAAIALRDVGFRRGGYEQDPLLEEAVGARELPSPQGYGQSHTLFRTRLGAAYDNRPPHPGPASGVRVEGLVEHVGHLRQSGSFLRYGATLGSFLDLNQRRRVVSLAVTTRFADPIAAAVIPFTELVTLGGDEPMRGLYPGRLHDRSAAVLQLGYRWPIWIWLDGALRTELGNVFGEHLAGFRPGRLRWSGALGLESTGTPDNSLQLLIAVASETFESGGQVDSWRLTLGTTSGF
jgi:hypothetical protein